MAKKEELQEQLNWFRNKYAVEEPELPLALDANVLKQRALSDVKPKTVTPWKKMLPMACALVLVVTVGLYSGLFTAVEKNNAAAPQMASYSLADASFPQTAAYAADEMAFSMARAVEYSVEVKNHLVSSGSKAVLRELYPNIQFYSLSLTGDFWTIIHVMGTEGETAVAVRADDAEVLEEEQCYVVRDKASGKELRFELISLKKMK